MCETLAKGVGTAGCETVGAVAVDLAPRGCWNGTRFNPAEAGTVFVSGCRWAVTEMRELRTLARETVMMDPAWDMGKQGGIDREEGVGSEN